MAKPKVYVTRRLPEEGMKILQSVADVKVYTGDPESYPPSRQEIMKNIADADGLLCWLTDKMDAEVMSAGKKLKVISNYAAGFDNIDVNAATERGIVVTNTPGVLTDATAECTWAILMALARRIPQADRYTREGKWRTWANIFLGKKLLGSTLGIIGLGRIGGAIAKMGKCFGMNVIYYDKFRNESLEKEIGIKFVDVQTVLKESDFVTLHVLLSEETKHMIGEKELNMMKPTAYLINVARGAVIDEKALVKALQEKRIAGAGLDVYENEPKDEASAKEFKENPLLKLENTITVPHIGSATLDTRTQMAVMAAENLAAVLKGKVPKNLVNQDVTKKVKLAN